MQPGVVFELWGAKMVLGALRRERVELLDTLFREKGAPRADFGTHGKPGAAKSGTTELQERCEGAAAGSVLGRGPQGRGHIQHESINLLEKGLIRNL